MREHGNTGTKHLIKTEAFNIIIINLRELGGVLMKKVLCFLITCSIVLYLSACGTSSSPDTIEYGDQDSFLSDMAKGISDRIAGDEDTSSMTAEELTAFYDKLADIELEQIEKYENVTFADEKFDKLAHQYISACQMQKTAAENYRDTDLYDALWDGGRTVRAGIIIYFYENYKLPISSEEASSYVSSTSVTHSVSGDSSILDDLFSDDDVYLDKGDLTIESATGTIKTDPWNNDSSFEYCYVVKNNSQYDLTMVGVTCAILDKDENILDTTSAYADVTIAAGKTVNCESEFNLKNYPAAKYVRIDSVSYDGDGDNIIHTVTIDDSVISRYTLTIE